MKSYYLFFTCCLLSSSLLAQKNAPIQRGYSLEHKDAQGKVIGRDSVVTYYWSSDGNTNMPDSMFNFQQMPNGFSFNFGGSQGGFGMPNDTTQNKRGMLPQNPFDSFFNDSFFNLGFPPDIQQMMEQQQRQLNEMMRRQPTTPTPNNPQSEPKAGEKKKYKSVQI